MDMTVEEWEKMLQSHETMVRQHDAYGEDVTPKEHQEFDDEMLLKDFLEYVASLYPET
jgi:hypothetical protein